MVVRLHDGRTVRAAGRIMVNRRPRSEQRNGRMLLLLMLLLEAATITIAAAAAVPVPAMVEDDTVWSDDSVGWVRWVGA